MLPPKYRYLRKGRSVFKKVIYTLNNAKSSMVG
jgi:hypothetical protein